MKTVDLPLMKTTHKGVYYFPTYTNAMMFAMSINAPKDRIIGFERGWAIQWHASGPYVGPESLTHDLPCSWCPVTEPVKAAAPRAIPDTDDIEQALRTAFRLGCECVESGYAARPHKGGLEDLITETIRKFTS